MKIKTVLREDEIQLTLTVSELVWLQVFLGEVIGGTLADSHMSGWKSEAFALLEILRGIKREGERMKPTDPNVPEEELTFTDEPSTIWR